MQIYHSPLDLQVTAWKWRSQGVNVGLVPTMGYLHQGHVSLMKHARDRANKVIVSLFVNPTQFGPNEDLSRYPRDFEHDVAVAEQAGVDVLFAPTPLDMYDDGSPVWVDVPDMALRLCGKTRPTHFRGVTTVVTKLLMLAMPQFAVFGEKDWQQLQILRRMVSALNIPVELIGCPIVREADGLALSSRNVNLAAEERRQAVNIYAGLTMAATRVADGVTDVSQLVADVQAYYERSMSLGRIDYLEVFHPFTLQPLASITGPARIAAAVFFEKARLIDNMALNNDLLSDPA
ncbi:pantoate--beta-alanine ligase [Desulfovibrio inopinatus]|uniref:pantoate--beta-alanine ligase n=1 Tax=Desulfovibrio inopinatus TaxID=102109 RepID=UPI00040DFCAA|nr:pantoate--beta-alanine ligase [Desulfovibrio inopinatus]